MGGDFLGAKPEALEASNVNEAELRDVRIGSETDMFVGANPDTAEFAAEASSGVEAFGHRDSTPRESFGLHRLIWHRTWDVWVDFWLLSGALLLIESQVH